MDAEKKLDSLVRVQEKMAAELELMRVSVEYHVKRTDQNEEQLELLKKMLEIFDRRLQSMEEVFRLLRRPLFWILGFIVLAIFGGPGAASQLIELFGG